MKHRCRVGIPGGRRCSDVEWQPGPGAGQDHVAVEMAVSCQLAPHAWQLTSKRHSSAPPRPQRLYNFSAAQHGISEAQAAEIATVFSAFDSDDNGYLSLDEFQRLWCVQGGAHQCLQGML